MSLKAFRPGLVLYGKPPRGKATGLILRPSLTLKTVKPIVLCTEKERPPAPDILDAKSQLLPGSDQKSAPTCVAHAIKNLAQFWHWRYLGVKKDIDPDAIYKQAKLIDGIDDDGTTLAAGLQAAQDLKIIPKILAENIREVQNWWELPRALHLYTVAVVAWDITESWFRPDKNGWVKDTGKKVGGHATLLCAASTTEPRPYMEWLGSWGLNNNNGFNKMSPETCSKHFVYALVAQWPSAQMADSPGGK